MVKRVTLLSLAIPLFIEMLFFSMLGMVDLFILSRVSDDAAGGVGACNQIISFTNIVFNIICIGANVLVSQYIGAKNKESAQMTMISSYLMVTSVGVLGSVVLFFFGKPILQLMGVTPNLLSHAEVYIRIVGSMMFMQAILNLSTVIMRTHGYSKETLGITAGMNVINVVGDILFVFGFNMGAAGAAYATCIGRFVAMLMAVRFVRRRILDKGPFRYIRNFPMRIIRDLFKVGLPSALENICYNVSQIVVTGIILHNLGDTAYITRTYTLQIIIIFLTMSMSIGQANQILIGHLVGAGKFDEAYHTCLSNFKKAFFITIGYSIVLFFFGGVFVKVFTDDPEILKWSAMVMMADAFLEPGRTFNLVIINGLKGSGDAVFPVIIGVISMWSIATLGAWLLGIVAGLGLLGIWIAMAADEWLRGFIALHRWHSRKWTSKSLVANEA
jgi:putative MATE family efflux protein